jgi:2-polyprenyl-3-methyl-5-hydroxy-6-metoxy-1,4-benzoquinol methylase
MNQVLQKMYEKHHLEKRSPGFTILADERGVFFKKFVGVGKSVLDIGCRDGALTKFFNEGNQVLGVDIDKNALARIANELGIETMFFDLNGDWDELGDKKFDVVVAGEIVEHLFYPEQVFKKVYSRLNEGGVFIGSVPNAFSLKNRLRYLKGSRVHTPLADPTHINHFSSNELENLLKEQFSSAEIIGLGKYQRLARFLPSWFAFDLLFVAKK